MKDKKIILYFTGGTMTGIFGAGVATTLQQADIYKHIKAIYGTSAGAFNAAYFLTKNMIQGSSIYYENLIENFIFPWRVPYAIYQRYINKYFKKINKKKILNVVDIDYLMNVVKNKKKLNFIKLQQQKIPFYVKALNINNKKSEWIDVQQGSYLNILQASVSLAPYYFEQQQINNKLYVDAYIIERLGLKYLLTKYSTDKIIVIDNINPYNKPIVKSRIKDFIEAFAAYPMFNFNSYKIINNRRKILKEDLKIIKENKNILYIYPPKNIIQPNETNQKKLLLLYKIGQEQAQKIIETIKFL